MLPLAVNSKSEQKVPSLPLLGFEPVTFCTLAHLSDRLAKSHPVNSLPFSSFGLQLSWCRHHSVRPA
jgi:hypothetical protein